MDLLQQTILRIEPLDKVWCDRASARLQELAIPHWSLGRLLDMGVQLAGICRSMKPEFPRKKIIVCAGDHGVAAEGVSAFPQEVTVHMVRNFLNGGASINSFARQAGADVMVADFGVADPLDFCRGHKNFISKKVMAGTMNFSQGPAMSREQAMKAVCGGIEIVRSMVDEADVFVTGDMGIANTTPSAAICSVLAGLPVADVTGAGTGVVGEALQHKIDVIQLAIDLNQPDAADGLDVLAKVGGLEIGGIAGVILGAAAARKPVMVDGFISTAGALIAHALCPQSADYIFCAHKSEERGHTAMLRKLRKEPLLDLGMRLGEGTGAVAALSLLEFAARTLYDIRTFAEVGF